LQVSEVHLFPWLRPPTIFSDQEVQKTTNKPTFYSKALFSFLQSFNGHKSQSSGILKIPASTTNMTLGTLFTIAALALSTRLYLHYHDTSNHPHIFGPSTNLLTTANLTNDLIDYAQALHSHQLQDFSLATKIFSFHRDYTTVTID
jgi:hypothetical protein